jgi:hypothetical protein
MQTRRPPLALLRNAATVLPRPVLAHFATAVVRGLDRSHPMLLSNLARLESAVVHIVPFDLPYRFALRTRFPSRSSATGHGLNPSICA